MKAIGAAVAAFRSDGLRGQLLRGGAGSIAIKIGATLISVGLGIILARTLGPHGLGVYSFVFSLVTILAIPAQMGLPNLVVRETAKAQTRDDWALIRGLWRWASMMALAMALGLMTLSVAVTWLLADRFPNDQLVVFYWGLALVPLVALGNLRGAALRGLRHVVQGQLPEFVLRPAFLIAFILVAHLGFSTRSITASYAMMLHALASLLAFVIGAYLLFRARPKPLREERIAKTHSRFWLASALPLGMVEGMQLINQNVGVIGLGIFANPQDVGIFRVALQGGMLASFGLTATNMIVGPYISGLYEQGKMDVLQKLVTYVTRLSFLMSLVVAIIFITSGSYILALLFGEKFTEAYAPLVIVIIGQVANAFTGCVGQILYMSKYEGDVAKAVAIGAFFNIVLVAVLGPLFGYIGVALAMTASVFIWNGILVFRVWQRTGIRAVAFWKV